MQVLRDGRNVRGVSDDYRRMEVIDVFTKNNVDRFVQDKVER